MSLKIHVTAEATNDAISIAEFLAGRFAAMMRQKILDLALCGSDGFPRRVKNVLDSYPVFRNHI